MSPAALYALAAGGIVAAGALAWHWIPKEIRRVFDAKPDYWPKRNEGGGWEQRDGRITKDRDGLIPIDRR